MRFFPTLSIIALTITVLSGCSLTCTPGQGEIIKQEVDLDLFTGIDIDSSIDVELSYGVNQKVVFEGYENHFPLLERGINSSVWEIDFIENVCTEDIRITITLPLLKHVEVNGSGSAIGKTPFTHEEFYLKVDGSGDINLDISAEDVELYSNGSGDITLSGYTETLSAEMSGSGSLEAETFESKNCELSISGSGDASVFASEELESRLSGSGSITYFGNPDQVRSDITGSGTVEKD